jgi:hypothetical protein
MSLMPTLHFEAGQLSRFLYLSNRIIKVSSESESQKVRSWKKCLHSRVPLQLIDRQLIDRQLVDFHKQTIDQPTIDRPKFLGLFDLT